MKTKIIILNIILLKIFTVYTLANTNESSDKTLPQENQISKVKTPKEIDLSKNLTKIAFGSCIHQSRKQSIWRDVIKKNPDLWVWLGDNIYGDTNDLDKLLEKYKKQQSNDGYQKLLDICPIIGIWDDHDYGKNDAGTELPFKKESQKLCLDFLNEPLDSARRSQEGIYTSYIFGDSADKKIKFILLDTRYHRGKLEKIDKVYQKNETGSMLGEKQWEWFEKELLTDNSRITVIFSSIQVIAKEHPFEKWANFPNERKKYLDLLKKASQKGIKNIVLVSGDRHLAEISKISLDGVQKPFYELTTSAMTQHSGDKFKDEPNKFRLGNNYGMRNYGLLEINYDEAQDKEDINTIKLSVIGYYNKVHIEQQIKLD